MKSAMAMVVGLGIALSCGPAQGANSHKLAVSATILTRIACRFANDAHSQLALFRCTSSDATATYRVRSDGGSGTLVVTVEP